MPGLNRIKKAIKKYGRKMLPGKKPTKKNKLRVALCISGQMRGYQKAFPSVKKNIIVPLQADVFIHTWEEIGSSSNEHRRILPNPLPHYLPKEIFHSYKKFSDAFPSYAAQISENEVVDRDHLEALYKPKGLVIERSPPKWDFDRFFGISVPEKLFNAQPKSQWSRQLFYKIWKCNQLKMQAEKEGGFTYDLVIRLRPDLSIGAEIAAEHLSDRNKLYHRIRTIDPSRQIADQYFYGSSEIMDKVCRTFENIPDLWREYEQGGRSYKHYWAEGLLYTSVKKEGDVPLAPFRTEPASKKSSFQLLSYSGKRHSYDIAKESLFEDVANQDTALSKTVTLGLSRVLAGYVEAELKENNGSKVVERCQNLIIEFEERMKLRAALARSIVALKSNDLQTAGREGKKALALENKSTKVLDIVSRVALAQKEFETAASHAHLGIDLPDEFGRENRPGKWRLFDTLGRAEESKGDFAAAYNAFLATFSLNPERAASAYRVGKMLFRLEQFDQALWFLREAQKLDPKHHAAAYFEAHTLLRLGMFMDAEGVVLRFTANPQDIGGKKTKFLGPSALIAAHRKQWGDVVATIEAYIDSGVFHEDEVLEFYYLLKDRLDEPQKAEEFFLRGLNALPDSPYLASSAETILGTGDYRTA